MSLKISVEIDGEETYREKRQRAIHGTFTFVVVDRHKQPIPVNPTQENGM